MAECALSTPRDAGNPTRPLRAAARARIEEQISTALADVELWISKLDAIDGDSDLEETGAEDDFSPHKLGKLLGPGCPLADPDLSADDMPCDDVIDPDLEFDHRDAPCLNYGVDQCRPLTLGELRLEGRLS